MNGRGATPKQSSHTDHRTSWLSNVPTSKLWPWNIRVFKTLQSAPGWDWLNKTHEAVSFITGYKKVTSSLALLETFFQVNNKSMTSVTSHPAFIYHFVLYFNICHETSSNIVTRIQLFLQSEHFSAVDQQIKAAQLVRVRATVASLWIVVFCHIANIARPIHI